MDIDKEFTDETLEIEGAWVEYRSGSRVKIARIGNSNFQKQYSARMKPYRRQQQLGTLDDELEMNLTCDVMSKTILLDWEGFTMGGKELPYSPQNAAMLLKKSVDFRNEITELATTAENFHAEEKEELEKN